MRSFGILHQRPHDLDALALAHRQPPHLAVGLERQPVVARQRREPVRHGGERLSGGEAERDVFGDGQVVEQREVLEHHADAERAGFGRPAQLDLVPHPPQLARGRLQEPVDDLDQSGFPGAVLAEQRMGLRGIEVEIDGIVGGKCAEPLGDVNGRQQRLAPRRLMRGLVKHATPLRLRHARAPPSPPRPRPRDGSGVGRRPRRQSRPAPCRGSR